jgi:ATP-binding cassette subfamily A (ABC1) protein 3
MALWGQIWTLTRKNLLINLNRHAFSTIIRAFILPVAFMIFLSYARNLFIPPSNYGIGSSHPIRTLQQGLDAASGGRNTLAFVNNGMTGGDIDRVIDIVSATANGIEVQKLTTQAELLDVCKSSLRGATRCYGAVDFLSSPSEGTGGYWNYTLRADGSFGTKIDVNKDTNDAEIYLLPLQRAVDYAIASINTTIDQAALPSIVYEYPYTSQTQAQRNTQIRVNYQGAIINILGVAFLIGMVGVTYHLTGFIASERELGMSQLIEAMMPNLKRWQPQFARILSYHLAFDIIYAPGWIIMAVVLGVGVFAKTSMAILIIYHVLAGLSLASFSILGASFFKKSQLSGITLALVTLLLGVLVQVVKPNGNGTVIILGLLFTPCNYVFFSTFMARYERQDIATDLVRAAPKNPWTLPGIGLWIFLIIQIFVYPLLGAMVERYLYGTASNGRSVVGQNLEHVAAVDERSPNSFDTVQLRNFTKHYRPNWFRRQFAGLTKTSKATVVAVNDLTLNASKGQIFVLLGANGSGKSTTLDAIAGLNTVTSGTITVDGTGGLGIAPQKNVLWDLVTVEEHIRIFNSLKSPTAKGDRASLYTLIKAIDLDRKIGARAKTLSGGQKRKLQLGMMFTGGSSVCCVDEVSSGLDPLSRRKIWDILLAERGSRTIILTTHFLDEADLLADRIAILSKGTLRAEGSSVELKERLGGGYRIHLQTGPGHEYAPDIKGISKHTTFGKIMYSASTSKQAAQIIKRLEQEDLTDYQLSGPTIEDVFLQLADEVRAESTSSLDRDTPTPTAETEKYPRVKTTEVSNPAYALELHSGRHIGFFRQSWVLFRKRATVLHRNYLPYTAALLLPIIAAGLVTLFLKGYKGAGCAPDQRISISDVESLVNQDSYYILAGPPGRVSNATLANLFASSLEGANISPEMVQYQLVLVDTLVEFNDFIDQKYANVTPAGFFIGDGSTPTTLAFKGNGGNNIYQAVFGQNILDIMLTNISISTQYSSFDIPWAPSTGKSLQLVVYFGLAMAAYPGFFSLYPTIERTRNIRGLMYSNGVRSLPLWLAYQVFDFFIVLISSAVSVIIFAAATSIWYHVGYLFLIFALFGIASILLSYVVSLFARTQLAAYAFAAAGQAVLFLIYLIGYLVTLTYAPVNKIDSDLLIVHFAISLVTPMGSLVRALFVALNIFSTTCAGKELAKNPGGILQYGGPILYLIVQILVLFAILLWYDSGSVVAWYRRLRKEPATATNDDIVADHEVEEELARVSSSNDGLRVLHLTKSFGHLTAVENMTFGIKRGEVFALLGPNGAGKSTTISLIRGDIQPSKNGGNVFVENIEINRHRAQARSHLGVCPQYDGMLPTFSFCFPTNKHSHGPNDRRRTPPLLCPRPRRPRNRTQRHLRNPRSRPDRLRRTNGSQTLRRQQAQTIPGHRANWQPDRPPPRRAQLWHGRCRQARHVEDARRRRTRPLPTPHNTQYGRSRRAGGPRGHHG